MGGQTAQASGAGELGPARVALVTGAAQGIGAAICRKLSMQGMRVIACDVDAAGAVRTAQALGPPHAARSCDVADEQAVTQLFDWVEADVGPVAVLICAAGIQIRPGGLRTPLVDLGIDAWRRTFDVNMLGSFLCSREMLRRRTRRAAMHARVVFVGSVGGQLGGPRSDAAYVASKGALMSYSKVFSREAAPLGMTANLIAPGLIDTAMLRQSIGAASDRDRAAAEVPLGRIGTVDEVAAAAAYLVSPDAAYVTGSVIDVNGGSRMQ